MKADKLSISKLIRIGFFIGIGAAIPIAVISYIPVLFIDDFMLMEFEGGMEDYVDDYIEFNPVDSELEAKIGMHKKVKDGWVFLGTLTNTGAHDWSNATVQIELFDEEGNFIDESDGYIQGAITKGTTHNFKVSFHAGDEDEEIVFSEFNVAVTGAY